MKQPFRLLLLLLLVCVAQLSAMAQDQPFTNKFPTSLNSDDSLGRTADNSKTTLSVALTASSATATVASTSSFPASGSFKVDNEIITYVSKTATQFLGLTRGVDGTAAASHNAAVAVLGPPLSLHRETLVDHAKAIEAKVGAGASTPTGANIFLQGIGPNATAWLPITAAQISAGLGFSPQPLDADLTALAALSTNGLAKKTGAGTWAIVTAPSGDVVGTLGVQTLDSKIFTNATINNFTSNAATLNNSILNNPTISGPTWSGNQAFPGNINVTGTANAAYFVGDASGLTNIPTGVVTPNSLSSTGSAGLNADTEVNGVGDVNITTRNLSRVNVGNAGLVGLGMPGDTGALYNQAVLNIKGRGDENIGGLKIWSTEVTATPVNFGIFEKSVANTVGSRRMQGYYMGTNISLSGREYPTKGSIQDGWEINWDSGNPNAPVQERWTNIQGDNGDQQRVMFYYSPLNNPELTQLEWALNNIQFEDWTNREAYMTLTPGKMSWTTTAAGGAPSIVTDSGEPLIYKATTPYPFINSSGESDLGQASPIARLFSGSATIDPSANIRVIFGGGAGRPELRYVPSLSQLQFTNNGTDYTNLSEGTKGVHRQWYTLAAASGSYTMIGAIGANVSGETPSTFTVAIVEQSGDAGGAKLFQVSLGAFGSQNVWVEAMPLSAFSGVGSDTSLRLDVKTDAVDGLTKLRLRRASTVASATPVYADVRVIDRLGQFTLSSETGTGAAIAGILKTTTSATTFDFGNGITETTGVGAPSGACTTGSKYTRIDGTLGATFYGCEASAWVTK